MHHFSDIKHICLFVLFGVFSYCVICSCKEYQNLNAFFAVVMGLSNNACSRLIQSWDKVPSKFKKLFMEFESLIDPSRNHRAYRYVKIYIIYVRVDESVSRIQFQFQIPYCIFISLSLVLISIFRHFIPQKFQ